MTASPSFDSMRQPAASHAGASNSQNNVAAPQTTNVIVSGQPRSGSKPLTGTNRRPSPISNVPATNSSHIALR